MANTIESVLDRALLRLRETTGTAEFWTDSELLSYANEGIKFTALDGLFYKKWFIIEVSANHRSYRIPDDTVGVRRVEYDNEAINHSTPERWDGDNYNWRTDSGTVVEYTMELDDNAIFLYRIPDADGTQYTQSSEYGTITGVLTDDTFDAEHGIISAVSIGQFSAEYGVVIHNKVGENNLRVYTYFVPEDVLAVDNVPYPLSKNDSLLEFYVLWACYEKDGEGQDIQKAQYYAQRFYQKYGLLKLRDELPRSSTIVGSSTYPSRYRSVRYPRLPDNYPRGR